MKEQLNKISDVMGTITDIEDANKKLRYLASVMYDTLEDNIPEEKLGQDFMNRVLYSQKDLFMQVSMILDYINSVGDKIKSVDAELEKLHKEIRDAN